jgi:hypothetical protein
MRDILFYQYFIEIKKTADIKVNIGRIKKKNLLDNNTPWNKTTISTLIMIFF